MEKQTRYDLPQDALPRFWYNINGEQLCPPQPVLRPDNLEPVTPDFLGVLFPPELIAQEVSQEKFIEIPPEVREIYKLWRPTPLLRARRLEQALRTPAHIYYKYEGVSPSGSHKSNTAIPQAFYNKIAGTKALTTETGAGQWGSAIALAGKFFDLAVEVYMVRSSYDQKPYRRFLIETYGGSVFASPSNRTVAGQEQLSLDANCPGSLGLAISEAVEKALVSQGKAKYCLGSVLNHVCLHQSIIGEEAIKQMLMTDEFPDVVIGCVGGGSNFAGIAYPFLREKTKHQTKTRFLAVEPTAAPSLTKGIYAYDYGDTAKMAPVVKMFTLGHDFMPPAIHAGGLRYHGMSPTLSALVDAGQVEAVAVDQRSVFEAATLFTQTEGILPAPESAHAIKVAIDEALAAKAAETKKTILFNLSGHGHFDLAAYHAYQQGDLHDVAYPDELRSQIASQLPLGGR